MKIFERRRFSDGGIHDNGIVEGYEYGESADKLIEKYNINHGFTVFSEISKEIFLKRKKQAEDNLKMFQI